MPVIINKNEIESYIGYQAEPTKWHLVTQEQINQFADCTLDHQFIHVDPEAAKNTPFGTTIAHGFLSLSMLSHFAESFTTVIDGFYMGINSGFDKVRFINPVAVNSEIRAVTKVLEIEETKPGQYRTKTEVTVEIKGIEKPALVAEWIAIQLVK
ncbi:MAG: MaoC family dehydratase [Kangiellaceae bacterium]